MSDYLLDDTPTRLTSDAGDLLTQDLPEEEEVVESLVFPLRIHLH